MDDIIQGTLWKVEFVAIDVAHNIRKRISMSCCAYAMEAIG